MSELSATEPAAPRGSMAARVAAARDRFEAHWRAGQRPRPEDYLDEAPESEHPILLYELLALDACYRRTHGELPHADEYHARFPALDLARIARAISPPPRAGAGTDGRADSTGVQRFRCPHCHNPIQLADAGPDEVLCPACGSTFRVRETRPTTTAARRRLGKFELVERVGVGAFGAVWKARDTELDRVVALKIPHTGLLTADEDLARFHREARAAGGYEAGPRLYGPPQERRLCLTGWRGRVLLMKS